MQKVALWIIENYNANFRKDVNFDLPLIIPAGFFTKDYFLSSVIGLFFFFV